MQKLNINSRKFYDEFESKNYEIRSGKPLRYIFHEASPNKYLEYPNQYYIDKDTELRYEPTRLNYDTYPSTSLYGTAPYKGRNDGPIDIESDLFHGVQNDMCNKISTETPVLKEGWIFENMIAGVPLKTIDDSMYKSTRNEYRNICYK